MEEQTETTMAPGERMDVDGGSYVPLQPEPEDDEPLTGAPFVIKKFSPVFFWSWDVHSDSCAICRVMLMEPCLNCQVNNKTSCVGKFIRVILRIYTVYVQTHCYILFCSFCSRMENAITPFTTAAWQPGSRAEVPVRGPQELAANAPFVKLNGSFSEWETKLGLSCIAINISEKNLIS